MEAIFDSIIEWLNEILISGILSNLSGLFDATNAQVGAIAGQMRPFQSLCKLKKLT